MSEDDLTPAAQPGGEAGQEPARPHRVIGTPPPAVARSMLGAPRADGPSGPRTLLDTGGDGGSRRALEPPDPARAKRAERWIAALFILSMLASIGFIAAYIGLPAGSVTKVFHSNLALGTAMTVAFLAVGAGAVIWVRRIMPNVEEVEERHPLASPRQDREAFQETFMKGAEQSGFIKRPIIRRTLIAATIPLAIAPIVLLRDMGPLPHGTLRYTVWRKGMRLLVYGPNRPIRPEDFDTPGSLITVVPEGYQDNLDVLAKATAIIIKFFPGQLQPPTNLSWCVQDIVCYSKICTHVGCPAALYEQTTHRILCPCHQSTFQANKGAQVTFGPAPRPLPQLPLAVDAEGFLVADGDFTEPVGPSFWERG